jgi:hypothetical protein
MSSGQALMRLILLVSMSLTVGVLAESRAQRSTLRSLGESDGRPLVAYLLVRAGDCESHHELLQLLERPSIARTTENGGALLIGNSASVRKARQVLGREMPSIRARQASMLERRLLWRLGFRQTPVLLVLNASTGAVRFSARAPLTIRDRVRLLRTLSAVTAE